MLAIAGGWCGGDVVLGVFNVSLAVVTKLYRIKCKILKLDLCHWTVNTRNDFINHSVNPSSEEIIFFQK